MRGLVPVRIQCHRVPGLPDSRVWQFASTWEETMVEFLPGVETSWELVDADPLLLPYLMLLSQFADLRPAALSHQAWVRSEERRHRDSFPVVLTCPLQSGEGLEALSSLYQWGKQGVIFTGASCSRYTLDQLGPEGSRLFKQLQEALEDLVAQTAGSLWYDISRKQAQETTQCLAEHYWALHQESADQPTNLVVPQLIRPEPISLEERRTRVRETKPEVCALVAKDPVAIAVRDDLITVELMRSLLGAQHFTKYEKHCLAERCITLSDARGDLLLSLQPQRGETWQDVKTMLSSLGDELVDTLCAIIALAIDVHGCGSHITDTVFFTAEDILQICQREKSHRAYVPEQKMRIMEHLRILAHIYLLFRSTQDGVQSRVKSPILHLLASTAGQYRQDTGEVIWERQAVKLGEWAALSIATNPPITLLRTILKYHPQRDRYAKRIGRGLLLQFFRNSHPAVSTGPEGQATLDPLEDGLTCSMQELLDLSGIVPDKNHPDVTRGRIEGGLERLVSDDVLASYHQVIEGIPAQPTQPARIRERARGWWPSYVSQHWRFMPSERLCTIYQQFRLSDINWCSRRQY